MKNENVCEVGMERQIVISECCNICGKLFTITFSPVYPAIDDLLYATHRQNLQRDIYWHKKFIHGKIGSLDAGHADFT